MPAPNAELYQGSPRANQQSTSFANDKNRVSETFISSDPLAQRKPEFYVGIFNVSKTELKVARSWAMGGTVIIPGRQEGETYSKPFILRDMVNVAKQPDLNMEIALVPQRGEFLAQDVCNCNDPYGSWKTYRPLNAATATSEGNNYYDRGVFWCRLTAPDAEPDLDAVDFAIGRLEKYYQNLIQEANLYYSSGPKEQAKICQPHHEAADYFIESGVKLNLPWHQVLSGNLHEQLAKAKAKKA
jgi:hypothetical protein